MSEPTKHHYIPKFLLAEWAVNKGKLWRFTRPYGKKIDQKLVAPAAIGYEDRLYTTSGLPDRYAQQFEKAFLSKVDHRGSQAHRLLMRDSPIVWTTPLRSDWTRFINSLLFRTPENLAAFKEAAGIRLASETPGQAAAYLTNKHDNWPGTLNETMDIIAPGWIEQAAMEMLPSLIDNGEWGERINEMVWNVGEMAPGHEFLISDAPLQHTTPIHAKGGHLMIPISPTRLFVATNEGDDDTLKMCMSLDPNNLVEQVNRAIVSRASIFVGATSLAQLNFVAEYFATEEHSTVIKRISRRYSEDTKGRSEASRSM